MHCRIALIFGVCGIPHLLTAQTSEPILVRIAPSAMDVQLGELFTVDLVADLGPHNVIGWGLDVAYNGSALSRIGSPTIGPLWMSSFAPDGDGLTGFSLAGSTGGDGVLLARVTYRADALGQTQLIPGYTPGDLNEGFPLDPVGFATIAFQPTLVNVVPEPTCGLFFAGLASFFLRRRRARRG